MTTIRISHYTIGKYLGTDDPTIAWSVFVNESPMCAETTETHARELAEGYFSRLKNVNLVEWDGDTLTEIELKSR